MKTWMLKDAWGLEHLRLVEAAEPPPPGPGCVAVRMRAASLNYRDLAMIGGKSPNARDVAAPNFVPFSDGAGEVIAVGPGVTRVRVGERVCPTFFQGWIDGPPTLANRARSLGSPQTPGVLQEIMVLDADGVTPIPAHLDDLEAATLPCAGLTAWHALEEVGFSPEKTVLTEGTGGVSIFVLQFATAAGARVIATSSSDAKLARAKALGASDLINYRETPKWGRAARDLTEGRGVDAIVEVGGAGTIEEAINALAVYGDIAVVGALSGAAQAPLQMVLAKNLRLHGVSVGRRTHFEAMSAAMAAHRIKPVVDRVYPFAEVPQALAAMAAGEHFGKICIDFGK